MTDSLMQRGINNFMGKIGITTIGIYGFAGAIMGMRAPMQSYHLSDSAFLI